MSNLVCQNGRPVQSGTNFRKYVWWTLIYANVWSFVYIILKSCVDCTCSIHSDLAKFDTSHGRCTMAKPHYVYNTERALLLTCHEILCLTWNNCTTSFLLSKEGSKFVFWKILCAHLHSLSFWQVQIRYLFNFRMVWFILHDDVVIGIMSTIELR